VNANVLLKLEDHETFPSDMATFRSSMKSLFRTLNISY